MLRPEEVEMLVCGNPTLNMAELKKVTVYDGYSSRDPTIKYELLIIVHHHLETSGFKIST